MLKVINLTKVKQVRRMKKKSWRLSLHCIHTVSWKHFPFFLFRLLRLFIIIYYILSFSPQIFKMKNIEKYKIFWVYLPGANAFLQVFFGSDCCCWSEPFVLLLCLLQKDWPTEVSSIPLLIKLNSDLLSFNLSNACFVIGGKLIWPKKSTESGIWTLKC